MCSITMYLKFSYSKFRFCSLNKIWLTTWVKSIFLLRLSLKNRLKSNSYTLFPMLKDCDISKHIVMIWSHQNSCLSLLLLYLLFIQLCSDIVFWVCKYCFQVAKIIIFKSQWETMCLKLLATKFSVEISFF